MVVSYHDGSLPSWQARGVSLQVHVQVEGRGGAVDPQQPALVPGSDAVWHLKLDLYKLLREYFDTDGSIIPRRLSTELASARSVSAGARTSGGPGRRCGPAAARVSTGERRRVASQARPLQVVT
ncbi:hypothetical protein PYW07_006095 [Mythimna separata]|uniref:Uncharacterized protein n=1 Tax=Mythimna separata TaxID=271217 RepID=A0AAD7YKN8_MYTSE|nr:hypothetical protein PYW07_006095 [Mythimna separata]